MNMNAGTTKNQVTDEKRLLFPVRVEYKIMDDFKKTLSKRPWEYLEEGNYEKYLKASEVKKEPSVHRKELLEVYAEILTLIKDKQKHINTQFVDPKYDLVKHDFKCICNNTIKFQYYNLPYEYHKPDKDIKVTEKKRILESEPEFKVKDLDFDKLTVPQVAKGEQPQFVSSRIDSEHTEFDPVVEGYFDPKQPKSVGTKLKKKGTKKVDGKESVKREETKMVKFDDVSDDYYNKYLDSDRTSSSDVPKKPTRKETLRELILLEHKNTFDAKELMCMPSLDLEALLEKKLSYKREPKVEPKANVVSPPVKIPSSTKKSSGSVNLEVDKLSHQEAEMRNDLLHLLESVAVFSDLPKSRLVEIIKHFKLKSYFAKSSIILAGEIPQEFYIVASGTVSSYTYEEDTRSILYKRTYLCSEYFGETFLMDNTVSNEFYVADSHVTVQAISASVFKKDLSDLFDAFRNRNKEFNNYGTYRPNTLMAPSAYFTNIELDKFASGDNTIKAKDVLGTKLMEFLNGYSSLSKFKYLEKLSKKFSYQEYLAKEILVGVCRNDNLFLVYRGTVSLQVYEEELNRQLELVSFGPGTFFFKFKYKSELVSGLVERSSFVAKDKVVLLCLEDKYVEKYLKYIVLEMSTYLENLYKSSYLALEKNKYKYLHSDQSSSSSKTVYSDIYQPKEVKPTGQKENEEDQSVDEEQESVTNVSLKSEEVGDKSDGSSVVSSSSTSVLSSTSRDDSSRHTRSSRSDGPRGERFDSYSKKTSSFDNNSDYKSKTSDQHEGSSVTKEDKKKDKDEDEKVAHEKLDMTKMSKRFSGDFSFTGAIVSRRSFDEPADVSIRSSLPNQLESSRTVSSLESTRLGKLQSKVLKKDEVFENKELKSSRSATTTEKDDESFLKSSLNKLNEALKRDGVKKTDSGSDKQMGDKESPSSKSPVKSLSSSKDDSDFIDNIFNKIGVYTSMFKTDIDKDKSISQKDDETEKVSEESDEYKQQEGEEEKVKIVKTVANVNVDEEDFIKKSTEEDYEVIRKNTLLASHVNISDTELSSRSHRSSVLKQNSLSRTQSYRSEKTGDAEKSLISSLREGSSFKESSNVGKDSKDSDVSSVGSDVKFIFNLDALKSGEYKLPLKHVVNLPKMKNEQQEVSVKQTKEQERYVEEEEGKPDSSRVMGNDNFVDIRNLTSYYSSNLNDIGIDLGMSEMGVASINEEVESLLEREKSEISDKIVYRKTSSSHLLTSRTTNENVLEPEDLSSVAKELGDVSVEMELGVNDPSLNMNNQEVQQEAEVKVDLLQTNEKEEQPNKTEHEKMEKEEGPEEHQNEDSKEKQELDDKSQTLDSHRSKSSLENLMNKNYPGVQESLDSVMEVIRTKSLERNAEETLTDLDVFYKPKEDKDQEYKHDYDGKEGNKENDKNNEVTELVKTMGTIDKVDNADENELEKSPSLDFGEIPTFKKILSRGYDMCVKPNLPVESVSGSKFPSIDEEYFQLDRLEKMHQTKEFDEVVNKAHEEKEVVDVIKSVGEIDYDGKEGNKEKEKDEVESLFDFNRLFKQSSYTSNNTLCENIYDSERDEVVPDEPSGKDSDSHKDKKQNKIEEGEEYSFSIENLTNDFNFDNIKRKLSNVGSNISSQISEVFSSKASEVDQQEVKVEVDGEGDSVEQKQNEDSGFSIFEKPKLMITSIFDNIPLYNSDDKNEEVQQEVDQHEGSSVTKEEKVEDGVIKEDKDKVEVDMKREVEQLLNKENVFIDKYNLVSRISLDSPSEVTSTSNSDKENVVSTEKDDESFENKELESSRSATTTEKDDESFLATEKDYKDDLSLKSPENVAIDDGPLTTDRSDETYISLKTSTVKSSPISRDEVTPSFEQKQNEEEPDLISNVGKDSKDSDVSSFMEEKGSSKGVEDTNVLDSGSIKSDSEGPIPLRTGDNLEENVVSTEKDDESLLSSVRDEFESQKSFVTSEKDTDKYTEKSLISSIDKSEKIHFESSISATESIHDTSFLSTDSESHLTSSSDSGSYDFKESSLHETDMGLESNQDDVASVTSSMTNNTYNTDNSDDKSKTSERLDSGRLSNAESLDSYSKKTSSFDSLLTSEMEDAENNGPTESESSIRSSSMDSNVDSGDQHEGSSATKEDKDQEYKHDNENHEDRNLDGYTDSFSDDEGDSVEQKQNEDGFELDNDFEMLEETVDSEEEEFEYDEETILSIKNLLMSTLKNKYKSLGTSFLAMDFERTGKVSCEVFLSFIEKLGIGAIDHREQNLMFDLLKEENQDYITFASFYKCSGETVTTLSELNRHFISIFGSSRIAFERFFTSLKKSTMCSQVDFVLMLNQVGIGEEYANKLFDILDVCKTQNVTVLTMLKMIVGDWDEKIALENEQKLNTKINRLLAYWSPESIEEFDSEFTTTLSTQIFDQTVEGSLVNASYEEFYIERDLKHFDQLSSLLSEKKEFSGVSLAQKRFIVSLFNIIDTSTTPPEAFMTESGQMDEQDVVLVSSEEVGAPLVALISGTLKMDFEGITNFNLKHANLTLPCLPNYHQFISSVSNMEIQSYMSGYYDSPQGSAEFNRPKTECGYSLSFKLGPNRNTVVGLLPLSIYLYNVVPLLYERNRRLPVMLQFLKSITSFNVYSPDELDKIVSACTVRQYKLHETVIKTGETPTHFYLVFDGNLTVTNEYNFEFKTVGKTEFFSSYDLVNNQSNNFTLIANCSLVLLSWERNEFFRVFNKYSTLVENDACNLNDFENIGLQKLVDKKVSFAECP